MSQDQWTAVDEYINELLVPADESLRTALETSDSAGLPPHGVTPNQGKLLQMIARVQQAKSILEIGTLGGYSTIWLARALPDDGRLITLEVNPQHADVARQNISRAGLTEIVDIRVGSARDTLPHLVDEGTGQFDLIFIDADKTSNPEYFEWSLKLSRPGTLIVVDNVIRRGEVLDESSDDPTIHGIRRFHEMVAAESRVTATAIQTVGSKGHDGFTIVLVTSDG